jgi:hypothetical protein
MQNNGAGLNSSGKYFFIIVALAYNDPNTDGAVIVQREVGDNLIILTIFAMQI